MIRPSLEDFRTLAKPGALVPVYREILADLETPVTAYMKIARGQQYSFLLESVERADKIGRYSFLGARPSLVFQSKGKKITLTREGRPSTYESDDPLGELRRLMADYKAVEVEGMPAFHGGAVGYMSYDQVRFFEKLPDNNPDTLDLPDLYFMVTDTILIFDHVNNRLKIVSNAHVRGEADAAYNEAIRKIDELENMLRKPLVVTTERVHAESEPDDSQIKSSLTKAEFCEAVEKAKEYIRAGDIFQVVLSQRLERPIYASPINLYRALRCINPSPYMTLVQYPDVTLVGCSPEVMTQVQHGTCMVRPIAGTRPRGLTPGDDAALEKDLLADEKERAEHIMLVDLGRNDVGRVSKPGTVKPSRLMTVERYSHVMHIVSEVEGDLLANQDAYSALKATFPAGTVSGAPKIRAMSIIDELEPVRRGPYAGACGYISFSGDMDTCIVIRTMVIKDNVAYVQAGAGVVYDSDPEREYEETMNKARALLRAADFAEKGLE
ncbi:MAG: anthranilate synthase component I [FCB group bacterium]|jgi:anthranilate synthase component 1|nr:anthranilate synthase component I [FCB group bacterium]